MELDKLVEKAECILIDNIFAIAKRYYKVKHAASYKPRVAGLLAAFESLNSFLPCNFRDNLSLGECQILNSGIKSLITRRSEFN